MISILDAGGATSDDASMRRASLTAALGSLLLLAAASGVPPEFERDPNGAALNGQSVADAVRSRVQRIAILPDRTTGMDWGLRYLKQAVTDLDRLQPDAVFTIGDMVQGYHRSEAEWTRQVDEYKAIVAPLTMPFYPVPGNHDVISGTRRAGDGTFAELYRRAFGPLWYRVDLERATVIVLFSDDGVGARPQLIREEQLAWLKTALDAGVSRGKPIIVLLHRPLWRSNAEHWSASVHPLLVDAKVRAVIAGHFHSMQHDEKVGGIDYLIVGTCGGSIDQHPLAGQMQHLTFVDLPAEGPIEIFHMPVGVTLPEDFVSRADQDRVYELLSDRGTVKWLGAFPDPYLTGAPDVQQVVLEFRNPLDVPVEVSIRQLREVPQPWFVGRENWVSWTPVDTFNPHVTALVGPFNISNLERHPVAPGDTTQIPVTIRSTPVGEPTQPPPFELTVTMQDRKGRSVPIRFPLRVPLERKIIAPRSIDRSQPFPISVWSPSPYDRFENDPRCRLAIEPGASGDVLVVEITTDDSWRSGFADDDRPFADRRDDPTSDAIRVRISTGDAAQEWLFEPFNGNSVYGDGATADEPVIRSDGTGWSHRLRIPWPGGSFRSEAKNRVNVGVADNDETYHTQWRWLSPSSHPAAIQLGDPPLQDHAAPPPRPRRRVPSAAPAARNPSAPVNEPAPAGG